MHASAQRVPLNCGALFRKEKKKKKKKRKEEILTKIIPPGINHDPCCFSDHYFEELSSF